MEKKELRKITKEELDMILKNHEQWLKTEGKDGERANLSYTDLTGVDLIWANLSGANLSWTNLHGAMLAYANLQGSNLSGANLKYAYLVGADLTSADLKDANLNDAELTNANLTYVKNFHIPMACPDSGSFIGWKHARNHIVKLEIPEDAKRSSGTGEKCRCNKATVLAIENKDGTSADVTEVCSDYDKNFIYKVGETVIVDDFDDNRFNECAPGIHFYMDRDSAFIGHTCGSRRTYRPFQP